jgi:type II secretory pathway component PulF
MPLEFQTAPAVETAAVPAPKRPALFSRETVGTKDRMAFTEQLSLLLETGMPLHGALQALAQQATPAMRSIIEALKEDVEGGHRFSEALGKHPELFSTTYVNLVGASEGGGFMYEVLEQLLAEEQQSEKLRRTMSSALSYPLFLSGFSVLVVVFILVVVFPKFGDMFARIEDQLPATTLALMWLSDVLRIYWWQCLAAIGAVIYAVMRWMRTPAGIARIDRWKLGIPFLRDIFVQLYLTQSLRVMSLSLSHGVSIMDTLESCKEVVSNSQFRSMLKSVEQTVRDGGQISTGFRDTPFVPDLVKQMLTTAEAAGSLAIVMGRIAEHYERELDRKLVKLGKMAEPVMLMIMGVLVGVIVSSLILPIFKLSKAVT